VALGRRDYPLEVRRIGSDRVVCREDAPPAPAWSDGWGKVYQWQGEHTVQSIDGVRPLRTREKGTLLLVRDTRPPEADRRALVLLAISAGYRGWTRIQRRIDDDWIDLDPGAPQWPEVLAVGRRAQGIAGRMGGHYEVLTLMAPDDEWRVERRGRLYGADPVVHVYWDGTELRVGPEDVVHPPPCETPEGEYL